MRPDRADRPARPDLPDQRDPTDPTDPTHLYFLILEAYQRTMQKVSPDGGAQRGTRVVPAWYPHGTRMVPGAKSVVPWVPNCNLTLLFVGYSKLASGGKFPFYNTKLKGS